MPHICSLTIVICFLSGGIFTSCHARHNAMQKSYPDDLNIIGSSGSLLPGANNYSLEIHSSGKCRFIRYRPSEIGPPLEDTTFTIGVEQLDLLWKTILQYNFFSLKSRYATGEIVDGAFASLTITAGGRTHQVEVENISVPDFEGLLNVVNKIMPPAKRLIYKSPFVEK